MKSLASRFEKWRGNLIEGCDAKYQPRRALPQHASYALRTRVDRRFHILRQ
jgi:hypothetical protein